MKAIRTSLLFASVVLVDACGASANKPAAASVAIAPASSVAATVPSAPAAAQQLTEADARAVVDAAEAASKSMNADAAIATLSDDVRLTMTPPASSSEPAQTIGRDQIIANMRKTAAEANEHAYSSQVGDVRLAADGASADVDVAVTEQMTVQGHKVEQTTDQTYTVANRQGQAKVVAITMKLTGVVVDGVKRL